MRDVPLFELPTMPPLPRPAERLDAAGPVRYTNYRPKWAGYCQDCATVAMEANRAGTGAPSCRTARFKRTQGALTIYLCAEHKAQRELDELAGSITST